MTVVRLAVLIACALSRSGCGGVVMGLSAAASVVSIARNVFDVDTSLKQQTPGKTPLNRIVP